MESGFVHPGASKTAGQTQNAVRPDNIGNAHRLADIVAWSNNKNKEPRGAESLDPRAWIDAELKKRFK